MRHFVTRFKILNAILLLSLFCFSITSHSQSYPKKPIVIVVPFGPGGSGDLMARTFAQYLEANLKQTVIVDNKPGADGMVGTEFVKNASPDGYTLLLTTNTTMAANSVFYKKISYDPLKDFDHIGLFGQAAHRLRQQQRRRLLASLRRCGSIAHNTHGRGPLLTPTH